MDRNQKAETSQSHFSPESSTLYISQLNMMNLILRTCFRSAGCTLSSYLLSEVA